MLIPYAFSSWKNALTLHLECCMPPCSTLSHAHSVTCYDSAQQGIDVLVSEEPTLQVCREGEWPKEQGRRCMKTKPQVKCIHVILQAQTASSTLLLTTHPSNWFHHGVALTLICIAPCLQVIETWSQWAPLLKHAQFRQQAIHFMRLLGQAMHDAQTPLVRPVALRGPAAMHHLQLAQ